MRKGVVLKLEDVTAEIRPRASWESIDLGCALVSRHLGAIWRAWLVTVLPLWILLAVFLRDHPVWFMCVTWWLKPVYDRVSLGVLSRVLFGDTPSVWAVLRAWPKQLVRRFWFTLFVGRLSPLRCLSLPVCELEGLRGVVYRKRVNLLGRNGGQGALVVTIVGLMLELVAGLSVVMLVIIMVPAEVSEGWRLVLGEWMMYADSLDFSEGFLWTVAIVRLVSFMLMEPFYVSAGFSLYINSRTLTEGWDIELAFRRLGGRLRKMKERGSGGGNLSVLLLGMMGLLSLGLCSDVRAGDEVVRQQAEEVLADRDFTVHYRYVDVPVAKSGDSGWLNELFEWLNNSTGESFLEGASELIFYSILWVLIVALVWLVYRNRHIFIITKSIDNRLRPTAPREMVGMSIVPESLPEDVVQAAREAWQADDTRVAMSLLYRGAISWLVHHEAMMIEESDTEGECLKRVMEHSGQVEAAYFTLLTEAWVQKSYGGKAPDDVVFAGLCDCWPFSEQKRRGIRL